MTRDGRTFDITCNALMVLTSSALSFHCYESGLTLLSEGIAMPSADKLPLSRSVCRCSGKTHSVGLSI